ncbi:MgtC/SapB family protein [Paenibacillus agricola]|uniref:Magnesium transporter MgtC n=1 Tax=Paenibacillus agricola TaxID=2716264 RepID=A0ABX0JI59_9BACL|nr:MgtC/SapB family protein [Paenibacillus agricola]NHN34647.1 magnesium transporter MgtC [Paenibacillus agricola]
MESIDQHLWSITHWELFWRLLLSTILGGLIGIEREWSNHAAGFRTHILVCLGSTTIMLLSIYGFSEYVNEPNVRIDPARLAAQVISGIGFLGAGAIMRNGNIIKGLTTAASIWVVAAIGLCVGAGFFTGALLCTLFVLISLYVLNKLERFKLKDRKNRELEIEVIDQAGILVKINSTFKEYGIEIVSMKVVSDYFTSRTDKESTTLVMQFTLQVKKQEKYMAAIDTITSWKTIVSMSY